MKKSLVTAGLSTRSAPPVDSSRSNCGGSAPRSWMTDELVQETCRVWSQAYEREVLEDEAMEILTNVKRLAETLLSIERSSQQT
jgi:hypothetical protein